MNELYSLTSAELPIDAAVKHYIGQMHGESGELHTSYSDPLPSTSDRADFRKLAGLHRFDLVADATCPLCHGRHISTSPELNNQLSKSGRY